MKSPIIIFSILTMLIMSQDIYAQKLSHHKWENRLVLILTNDIDNPTYQSQLLEFNKEAEGLAERKLIIYQVLPDKYVTGLADSSEWIVSSKLYGNYQKESVFEVILIGLDGRIKLRQTEILSCEALFSLIDTMPMRQAELREKK